MSTDKLKAEDRSAVLSKRGHDYGVHHFHAPQGGDLVTIISSVISLPEDQVFELLCLGSIYLNHERCEKEKVNGVQAGDYLRVHTRPRRFPTLDVVTKNQVIAETDDFIVVNKPAGIPVHPTVDNRLENLITSLSQQLNFPLFVTHRLDVPTEGLIIFAKTKRFQKQFNQMLQDSSVRKIYKALVETNLISPKMTKQGSIVHFMEPSPRAPKVVSSEEREGWQRCSLKILELKQVCTGITEVTIELETGRTHQIRTQLALEGCPILGDVMYGSTKKYGEEFESIALQSYQVSFPPGYCFQLEKKLGAGLF